MPHLVIPLISSASRNLALPKFAVFLGSIYRAFASERNPTSSSTAASPAPSASLNDKHLFIPQPIMIPLIPSASRRLALPEFAAVFLGLVKKTTGSPSSSDYDNNNNNNNNEKIVPVILPHLPIPILISILLALVSLSGRSFASIIQRKGGGASELTQVNRRENPVSLSWEKGSQVNQFA